jgi:hypothetical protein
MTYKFYKDPETGNQNLFIIRLTDGAWIPCDKENRNYQEYLEWVNDGNTTEAAD